MIFIFSAPRSGSTWLAKALTSERRTLYLHEPDIVDRGADLLPFWFSDEPAGYEDKARQYLERLASNRNLRTVSVPPFFPKHFRAEKHRALHTSLIYFGKGMERAGLRVLAERMSVPGFVQPGHEPRLVVKSVSALGRAEAFLKCGYPLTPILLLRHPCGFVNSYLQGLRRGAMPRLTRFDQLLETRSARRLNAKTAVNDDSEYIDRLAWTWLLANAEAYTAVAESGGFILDYDKLTRDPEPQLCALFASLGLEWSETTSWFLEHSTAGDGGSYFSLSRGAGSADRWASQMRADDIERVREIVCQEEIGRSFFDEPLPHSLVRVGSSWAKPSHRDTAKNRRHSDPRPA